MNEYLKMADTFALIESDNFQSSMVALLIAKASMPHSEASAISHAVSWHDEIVRRNDHLRNLLKKCRPYIKDESDWGYDGEMNLLEEIDKATGEAE